MNSQPDYEAALRKTIREGLAVVVAGTGVSIGASYDATTQQPHPQASWSGLLENGLQWLKERKLMDEDEVNAQLTLLKKNPQTHRFISVAEDVTEGMGTAKSKHFAEWLKRSIGSIKAHDRSVLDALEAIRKQGNLLATTNYDGLLLEGDDARSEAERLARLRRPANRYLALLWKVIGDFEQAKFHGLKAYEWAWADGEPYVHRYELTKTTELLNELSVPIPNLPPYDPTKDEPFAWEADVRAAMEKLRAEKRRS